MSHDPFYQQIICGLKGDLNPSPFEDCVTDILRKIYPTLVSMRGGNDAGMDGAIADLEGEPFPLVVTTAKNVIGNLNKNINSYLKKGRKRRKVLLATSRYLTPKRIQNLYDKANALGFTLVQVYSQPDIANLLYYNPRWCKTLLNLDGKPSALSIFPKTNRPEVNENLIAREADFQWLVETSGDKLLVGHPGSGKTHLLKSFSKAGLGLFIVSDDMEEIIAAYRSQQPTAIIVDDAQLSLSLISRLIHFRKEICASFSILASCWYGDADTLAVALGLPKHQIHNLELLSRDEIVEVIKDAGLIGPERLIKEIVDQAEGRPGLAATLVHLCQQGDIRRVFLGEALNSSIRRFFEPQLGKRAINLLAAFAIGGNFGMSIQAVSIALGISPSEVHEIAVQLATGGILWEVNDQELAVYPEPLRHTLVKDIFFNGAYSLPIHPLLNSAPNYFEAVHTIIGAYARGAIVSWSFLLDLLEKANSGYLWKQFAWQGVKETNWVIQNHPELLVEIGFPALKHNPNLTITMLLELAIGDERPLHATTDHPLRMIDDWIKESWPGDEETVGDRITLIKAAYNWIEQGKDIQIGLKTLCIAFSPLCEKTTTDPGAGNTVTIRNTYLLPDEMEKIQGQWRKYVGLLKGKEIKNWQPLSDLFHSWAFPELRDLQIPVSTRDLMRSFAKEIIENMTELAGERQGVLHLVKQLALYAHFDIDIRMNEEFEILYPIEERDNFRDAEAKEKQAVEQLAVKWSRQSAAEVANKLICIEQEAVNADISWPRWSGYLCTTISNNVSNPFNWAQTFIDKGVPVDLIMPFVEKSSQLNKSGWVDILKVCLSKPALRVIAFHECLSADDLPEELLCDVLNQISEYKGLIETLCLRKQVPEKNLRKLLTHPDNSIRAATAKGVRYAYQHGDIPASYVEEWLNAVIQSKDDYFISGIIKQYPGIALKWLTKVIQSDRGNIDNYIGSIQSAAAILNDEEKIILFEIIPDHWEYAEIVFCLVGDNIETFRSLLSIERLREFHLVPLTWEDSDVWIEKAKIALEKGFSPQEIAQSAYGFPYRVECWTGTESNIRQEWVNRFNKLCSNLDASIREIGRVGRLYAEEELQRAQHRERNEEIFGKRRYRRY